MRSGRSPLATATPWATTGEEAGLGVSLLPALALSSARRDDVVVRAVAGEPARMVEVVLPVAERRPPAVTATLAALRAAADELVAGPEAAALGLSGVAA